MPKIIFVNKSLEKLHVKVLNRKTNNSKPKKTPSTFEVYKRYVITPSKQIFDCMCKNV